MSPNVTTHFATDENRNINTIGVICKKHMLYIYVCIKKQMTNVSFFAFKSFWEYTCSSLFTSIYN
jgi:hypothetical protein